MKGLEALKEHFKNSKFPCETDHYLPAVFTPPRDGRQLTEPFPIVGQSNQPQALPIDDDDGAGAPEKVGDAAQGSDLCMRARARRGGEAQSLHHKAAAAAA